MAGRELRDHLPAAVVGAWAPQAAGSQAAPQLRQHTAAYATAARIKTRLPPSALLYAAAAALTEAAGT